jgi:hypothetical protein
MTPRLSIGLVVLLGLLTPAFSDTKAPFAAKPFPGRKSPSDRVVVMELFLGAQCPPSVPANVACQALQERYKSSELVLLQYHLHIPGPDPLTNPHGVARFDYYSKAFPGKVFGTPTALFGGRTIVPGGGPLAFGEKKYAEYREIIDSALEKPAAAKLTARATRQGEKLALDVEVSDLADPGPDKRLRLALVEKSVRYTGRNRQSVHHQVVRAMPGGPAGFALERKDFKHTAPFDLGELRKWLHGHLDEVAAKQPFADANRPMDFNGLRLVAFVQDEGTKEILQAVQAEVGHDRGGK